MTIRQTIDTSKEDREFLRVFGELIDDVCEMSHEMFFVDKAALLSPIYRKMLMEKVTELARMKRAIGMKPLCVDNPGAPLKNTYTVPLGE